MCITLERGYDNIVGKLQSVECRDTEDCRARTVPAGKSDLILITGLLKMSIELIIFDMDGVLVNSEPAITFASLQTLKSAALTPSTRISMPFTGRRRQVHCRGVQKYGAAYDPSMKARAYEIPSSARMSGSRCSRGRSRYSPHVQRIQAGGGVGLRSGEG